MFNGGVLMAFDGIMLSSVIAELKSKILGGRIDRIYQPEKDEIHIYIRSNRKNYILLLTANSSYPRIHLTKYTKVNPETPPMFCMVLRKHLVNARIVDIKQPRFDRICHIHVESIDELGDLSVKTLAIEVMGRHSNIILFDNDEKIIDSIKRIPDTVSRVRQVLPGENYTLPPGKEKQNPLLEDGSNLKQLLTQVRVDQFPRTILNNFMGISKVSANEIVHRGLKDQNKKYSFPEQVDMTCAAFIDFFNNVKEHSFQPVLLEDEFGQPIDILPFIYMQFSLELQKSYKSPSEAVDLYYLERDKINRIRQRSSDLYKILKRHLEHNENKLAIQKQELNRAKGAKRYQLWGELITANIYQIPEGISEVTLLNYYDPDGSSETIPLDPSKTPAQNAEKYFKKYTKLKNAFRQLSKQVVETADEVKYIEGQIENLNNCTEELEIDEIRDELISAGYLKRPHKKARKKRSKRVYSKPHHYISSDGHDIYVGKNNTQNDYLTLRMANDDDIWMHVKTIPGSHVIIRSQGKEVPSTTLEEGAMLAAYYSKGKHSSNVEVDYCLKRHVRKPSGAKPGMVIYDNHSTLYVTPEFQLIKELEKV